MSVLIDPYYQKSFGLIFNIENAIEQITHLLAEGIYDDDVVHLGTHWSFWSDDYINARTLAKATVAGGVSQSALIKRFPSANWWTFTLRQVGNQITVSAPQVWQSKDAINVLKQIASAFNGTKIYSERCGAYTFHELSVKVK